MKNPRIALFLTACLLLCGCLEDRTGQQVTLNATGTWKADGVIEDGEYSRAMNLSRPPSQGYTGGELEVRWKNDEQNLYLALAGRTSGWISLGFDPQEWMKDCDIIMGSVQNGRVVVRDSYSIGNYGPHPNDTELGGTYDILDFGGRQDGEYTVIEISRRLDSGDKYDRRLSPGQAVPVIWALADSDLSDQKHNVARGESVLELIGGGAALISSGLSLSEAAGLKYIREEEKLSRDLYSSSALRYGLPIFSNIATSEQNHMDAVKPLIDRYGLSDPILPEPGRFADRFLQDLWDNVSAQSNVSEEDALAAAALVEEMSITDLQRKIAENTLEDIRVVYMGLLSGSEKHLRSYIGVMKQRGYSYRPFLLSPAEFQRIMDFG